MAGVEQGKCVGELPFFSDGRARRDFQPRFRGEKDQSSQKFEIHHATHAKYSIPVSTSGSPVAAQAASHARPA